MEFACFNRYNADLLCAAPVITNSSKCFDELMSSSGVTSSTWYPRFSQSPLIFPARSRSWVETRILMASESFNIARLTLSVRDIS